MDSAIAETTFKLPNPPKSCKRTNMSCDICLKQFSAGRRQQVIPCKATKCHISIHREYYPGGMDAVTFVYNKKNNLFDFECAKCSLLPDHTPVVPIQPSNQSAIKKGRGRPKKKEEPPTRKYRNQRLLLHRQCNLQ